MAGRITFTDHAWIASAWRSTQCELTSHSHRLTIEGLGQIEVESDGSSIQVVPVVGRKIELAVEAVLGPGFALAVAARGIFLLHASAVAIGGRAYVFVGASGAGKSTLASALDSECSEISLVADDIVPLGRGQRGVEVYPAYPQLKLPADLQPARFQPSRLPLERVFFLSAGSARCQALEIMRRNRADTAAHLIQHTVASRIFDEPLLDRHMDFCGHVAESVDGFEIRYPWDRFSIRAVADAIQSNLHDPESGTSKGSA